jgi:predicted membrane channel-forming protein YqfA (hemolysin III family)
MRARLDRLVMLFFALATIWLIATSVIYRFCNSEQTETELFLHLWDAVRLKF